MKSRESRLSLTLEYIRDYQRMRGITPSYREIMKSCGQKSLSTVSSDVNALASSGKLGLDGEESWRKISVPSNLRREKTKMVPVVGECPCGEPIMAVENIEFSVSLPESIFGSGEMFILKAVGSSMIECGIYDGDLMVVLSDAAAKEGDIVVAMVNDEDATTKLLRQKEGKYYLSPANSALGDDGKRIYSDIFPEKLTILGVVSKVIHTPSRGHFA
ncbi:MAG: repressor LexA [Clostridia bacterium]|nr:repressor LexA [Clostridia bacterium]